MYYAFMGLVLHIQTALKICVLFFFYLHHSGPLFGRQRSVTTFTQLMGLHYSKYCNIEFCYSAFLKRIIVQTNETSILRLYRQVVGRSASYFVLLFIT